MVYVGGHSQRLGVGTDYDYIVLKLDAATGSPKARYQYNGAANGTDEVSSLVVDDNGNIALTGLSYSDSTYNWLTQYLSKTLGIEEQGLENNSFAYPNPTNDDGSFELSGIDSTHPTISVTDASGKLVDFIQNQSKITLPEITGIYLITVKTEHGVRHFKILRN